jgi:hypothetical protein
MSMCGVLCVVCVMCVVYFLCSVCVAYDTSIVRCVLVYYGVCVVCGVCCAWCGGPGLCCVLGYVRFVLSCSVLCVVWCVLFCVLCCVCGVL